MSIPTSLIVVILVAAWLTVLVPMVARRREPVPETETDGATFRVLRRASASIRRRPGAGRRKDADHADDMEEDDIAEELDGEEGVGEEPLDEELLDDGDDEGDEFAEDDYTRADVETEYGQTEYVETDVIVEPVPAARSRRDPLEGVDEARLRPVPRRPGRGGFDPDAAEIARAYRYSRRRRITVVLLLATIAFSAAAYLFKPILWSGTAFFALLLVAYLGYLRRQVRIENDIRERRLARLRRARQIRPEYHLDRADTLFPGSSPVGGAVPVSQVPPTGYRRGREVVDLEDDDPSFDDLDYYEPVAYRRASGQ